MDILTIIPSDTVSIDIEDQESFLSLLAEAGEDIICRAVISDQVGYGVVLPATINQQDKTITFVLPEQLCIFSPKTTYLIKIETILETQLLMPYIGEARIALLDDSSPENDSDELSDVPEDEATEEALNGPADDDDMDDLDQVLAVIAPIAINEQKRTKLEDLLKGLDGDFVKQALWQRQQASIPPVVNTRLLKPVGLELNPDQLVFKQKMKTLLKGMLG